MSLLEPDFKMYYTICDYRLVWVTSFCPVAWAKRTRTQNENDTSIKATLLYGSYYGVCYEAMFGPVTSNIVQQGR